MPRRIKMQVRGKEVECVELDFEVKREEWNEYLLSDGGRVRVKTTVAKIYRALDAEGKPANDAEGDPMVVLKHATQVVASSG